MQPDETAADSGETELSGETLNALESVSVANGLSETDGSSETAVVSSGYGNQEVSQASSEGKTEEADAAQSERMDEMGAYVSSFQPEISVSAGAEDSYSDFLDGRETQFLEAVGEYVYSIFIRFLRSYDLGYPLVKMKVPDSGFNKEGIDFGGKKMLNQFSRTELLLGKECIPCASVCIGYSE